MVSQKKMVFIYLLKGGLGARERKKGDATLKAGD